MPCLARMVAIHVMAASCLVSGCSKDADVAKREYLQGGNKYLEQKQYKEAIVEYRNALKLDPKFGEARFKLAGAYALAGDQRNAFREYVRAADLLPDNVDAQLKAGHYLVLARQFEDAKTLIDKVLAKDPRNVIAQILRGNALAGLKDLDGAISEVQEAIDIDPARSGSYTSLALLKLAKGRAEEAEAAFKKAAEIDPKSVAPRLALANYYWAAGRNEEAEKLLTEALAAEPQNLQAHRALATFYIASKRAPQAEKHLKAIADITQNAAARLALADFYIGTERMPEAVKILDGLAADPQGFAAAKGRIATIAYVEGRRDEAYRTIDEVLAKEPKSAIALTAKSRFFLGENKPDQALPLAQAAAAADPQSAVAHYIIGSIFAARRDIDGATKAFNEVLKLNPRAVSAQLQLSRLHMRQGGAGAETSVQLAQDAVNNQPENPSARLILARSLIVRGELVRAETELKRLVEKYPNAAPVQALMGSLAAVRRDFATARRHFDRAIDLDPNLLEPVAGLITLDMAANRPAEARAKLDSRLQQSPNSPGLLLLAARVYGVIGDFAASERALRKLIEIEPANLDAYGLLGQVYLRQRKLDQALREFQELAKRQQKPVGAETMMGMILQIQNKDAEAQQHYEKAIALDATAPVAANNLAWMYAESGANLDMALQLAQAAKAKLPDRPEVNDTLGWVYFKKDLAFQALQHFQESIDKDPNNPLYHYHLGMTHMKRQEWEKARQALERALQLNPNFAGSAEARKALTQIQG